MTSSKDAKTAVPKQKSQSVSEANDPRSEKTRALISAAFVHLLMRRPYERIRVSDVTRKAGVGRATFYAHFDSKEALLSSELIRVVHPMICFLPGEPCLIDCTKLFAHLLHAREIYRSLMSGNSRVVTERIIQDTLETRIGELMVLSSTRHDVAHAQPTFVPRFIASTILTLIAWSLEQPESPPPAELQRTYRSLVGQALRGEATN
jgi:AcrR family transcriptional regulator